MRQIVLDLFFPPEEETECLRWLYIVHRGNTANKFIVEPELKQSLPPLDPILLTMTFYAKCLIKLSFVISKTDPEI